MKLLECHVDNFGKLSNYEYRFSESLTVIQEPNGFGKVRWLRLSRRCCMDFPEPLDETLRVTNGRNIFRGRAEPMAEAWISSLTEPLTGCGGRLERPQRKIPLSFGI